MGQARLGWAGPTRCSFGSTRNISVVGTPIFTSDPFPPLDDQFASSEPLEIEPHAAIPDKARSVFNISGMSYWRDLEARRSRAAFMFAPGCIPTPQAGPATEHAPQTVP